MPDEAITGTRATGPDEDARDDALDATNRADERERLPALPSHVSVGCAGLAPGLRRVRYFQRLGYLENEGTRIQLPRHKVLKRWLEEAESALPTVTSGVTSGKPSGEPSGRFGLYAPQEITDKPGKQGYPRSKRAWTREELWQAGGFRDTEVVRASVQATAEACAVVRASAVIFRSPPDFVPSASNRDTLRKFFTEIATPERFGSTVRVWEPLGLWEVMASARFAAELGVTLVCDPLSNNPLDHPEQLLTELPGERAYFRMTGLGRGTQRFDDYALEPLLDAVHAYRQVWIVFAHTHKYPDAIRCHRLLATLTAE